MVVRDQGGYAPDPFFHFLIIHGIALGPDASEFMKELSPVHKRVRSVGGQGSSVEISFHLR
jgi:hypothetical protein